MKTVKIQLEKVTKTNETYYVVIVDGNVFEVRLDYHEAKKIYDQVVASNAKNEVREIIEETVINI